MGSPHDLISYRADFFAENLKKNRIRSVTKIILYDLEFPISCEGFDFLEMIIPMAYNEPAPINLQELYRSVARICPGYHETAIGVAVQESIDKAWRRRYGGRWNFYFPDYVIRRKKAPSNKEFIKAMVYFIDMWQDSYEKEADENAGTEYQRPSGDSGRPFDTAAAADAG